MNNKPHTQDSSTAPAPPQTNPPISKATIGIMGIPHCRAGLHIAL